MKIILKFAFILFLVNLIAASILAGTYSLTKSRIQKQESMIQEEALKQVMPEAVGGRIEIVKENGVVKYREVFKEATQNRRDIYILLKNMATRAL